MTGAFDRDLLWQPFEFGERALLNFFRDAIELLTAVHFGPDIPGLYARFGPKHHEVIEQVRAFADDFFAVACGGFKGNLGGFLSGWRGLFYALQRFTAELLLSLYLVERLIKRKVK